MGLRCEGCVGLTKNFRLPIAEGVCVHCDGNGLHDLLPRH